MTPDPQGTEDYLYQLVRSQHMLHQARRLVHDHFSESDSQLGERILRLIPPIYVDVSRVNPETIGYEIRINHYRDAVLSK